MELDQAVASSEKEVPLPDPPTFPQDQIWPQTRAPTTTSNSCPQEASLHPVQTKIKPLHY